MRKNLFSFIRSVLLLATSLFIFLMLFTSVPTKKAIAQDVQCRTQTWNCNDYNPFTNGTQCMLISAGLNCDPCGGQHCQN